MERFLRIALGIFLVSIALGVMLRFAMIQPIPGLNFTNALHAHSHTLYFGWAGLGLYTLFFDRLGPLDAAVRRALWALVVVSILTFMAFLHAGYRMPGIGASTLSLVAWGWVVALFLKRLRGQRGVDVPWLRVATWYIVFASAGAGLRVVLLVRKADPLWGRLGVAFFLTAFAGFFLFGVVGLLARHLEQQGAPLDRRMLRWQLGWMTPLVALTFPLGIPNGMDTFFGPMARVASVLLVVPAALWLVNLWVSVRPLTPGRRVALRSVGVVWALKAIFEVGAAFGLDVLAATSRHAVIFHIHLVLLGVVTAALLYLARERLGRPTGVSILAHQGALAVMCAGLLLSSMGAMGVLHVGMGGLWVAAVGAALVLLVDGVLVFDALGWRLRHGHDAPAALGQQAG